MTRNRAVIYARYSSDLQSAASIPDQVRLCQKLCRENGWAVLEVFADEAMSGASHLRPDFQRMQQLAMNGGFDVLVAESLDRLSRDQEHIAGLHKRLRYGGIVIVTKAEGEINEMHVGLGGTMSALYLRQLAQKTHRGLEGRVRAGKSAGGISYGYRVNRQLQPDGSFTAGDRRIDPEQAAVVRRIFRDYARGESSRSIAFALNREAIPSPSGRLWSFSTISGNWKRGTGILNNELYIGRLVWNRQRFVKDPDTGKRQARPNPESEWLIEEVPQLRIIDDDLWQRVKLRQGVLRNAILDARSENHPAPRTERARRNRYLLSGLLRCGCCGAGYSMVSDSRYGCSAARNKGTCTNRKTIRRSEVESRVLDALRDRLMAPDLLAAFIEEYHAELRKGQCEAQIMRASNERQLAQVERQITQIVAAIADGMYHPSMKEKMDGLEATKAQLTARRAELGEPEPVILHPGIAEIYKRKVADLQAALHGDGDRPEAADLLRGLIDRIVIHPQSAGHDIDLHGQLAAILALCTAQEGTNAKARTVGAGLKQVTVVAGAGFEPAAFRL